jgi:hypothetical protein
MVTHEAGRGCLGVLGRSLLLLRLAAAVEKTLSKKRSQY